MEISVPNPLQPGGDATSMNERERWREKYIANAIQRSQRMGLGPVNLPVRKSIDERLSDYLGALSRKKAAVLALADAEVECEECEAELIEVYGPERLKQVRDAYYVTDDPQTATATYFDAVSAIRFDPLEL